MVTEATQQFVKKIVQFIWPRNPMWWVMTTPDKMFFYILNHLRNVYVKTKEGLIEMVAVYQKCKDEVYFMSVTVRDGADGVSLIRESIRRIAEKERATRVSWLDPEFRFRTYKIKGR